jgi:hypothetical protein
MSDWTQRDRHIGIWSAASVPAIVVVYVIAGLIGVVVRPPSPNLLSQVDPYLAILEVLLSLAALGFTVAFAVLTCGAHFASLTAGRQLDPVVSPLLSRLLSFDK